MKVGFEDLPVFGSGRDGERVNAVLCIFAARDCDLRETVRNGRKNEKKKKIETGFGKSVEEARLVGWL